MKAERRAFLESVVYQENPAIQGSNTQPMAHQGKRENPDHEGSAERRKGAVETEKTGPIVGCLGMADLEKNESFLALKAKGPRGGTGPSGPLGPS